MKTTSNIIGLIASAALALSCDKKEVYFEDSPLINVMSPTRHQVFNDSDSIKIQATISQLNNPVRSYHVFVVDENKKDIFNKTGSCNCENPDLLEIDTAFMYNTNKTSDLLLHIQAELKNGEHIREEIPIQLVDKID